METPLWILFIVGGIIMSAFMALKTGKEERRIEYEQIEKEGEIYMERLQKEREERAERRSFV
jgi:Sporulation protein YhaL